MPQFVNFYENIQEAKIRVENTVVLYDGVPHHLFALGTSPNDDKIRVYLDDYQGGPLARYRHDRFPRYNDHSPNSYPAAVDQWIENNPQGGVKRKLLGSAKFNKFRPFPLGNVNKDGTVVFVERTPTRNTFQGLKERSLIGCLVQPIPDLSRRQKNGRGDTNVYVDVGLFSPGLYNTMLNKYPSIQEVIDAFRNPRTLNTGIAFHRDFSIFRGPLGMLFLCYQNEGVGLLINRDLSELYLSSEQRHLFETIAELSIFNTITIKE